MDIKVCILIPTYNNAQTLGQVMESVLAQGLPVIVVNDGSTDPTSAVLHAFQGRITLLEHQENIGKGAALRKGLAHAVQQGFTHAIAMDSDGQHLASELPGFMDAIEQAPGAFILGARDLNAEGAPGKSSFGNRFSNFWTYVETGLKLPDTQTGFRAYPLDAIRDMRFYTKKFEFEIEVLIRLAWKGTLVKSIPIRSIYGEERVSHFRPFADFFRISVLNTVLVLIAFFWQHPKRLFLYVRRKGFWQVLKQDLIDVNEPPGRKAASIGFGVFMGIVPIWGFQMLVAAFLAVLFRLNKFIVLAFSNISVPPLIPIIVFVSFYLGSFLVEEPRLFPNWQELSLESIYVDLKQYILGSLLFATIAGFMVFGVSYCLLALFQKGKARAVQEN